MTVTLHGFRWDASSSFMRGAAGGPDAIREHLFSDHSNAYSIAGADVQTIITRFDFEDLPEEAADARRAISLRIATSLSEGQRPLSLGGDHSISFPILTAIRDAHGPVNILHIDAHPDTYPEFEGDPYSHACPFYHAIKDGCVGSLVQVGLRSVTPDARAFGRDHGIVMLGADEAGEIPYNRLAGPTYVSIDLDGIDPAFAPGVAHPEPGGLTSLEVISMINKLSGPIIGADVVELNPGQDVGLLTTHLAVRLVKELAGRMGA